MMQAPADRSLDGTLGVTTIVLLGMLAITLVIVPLVIVMTPPTWVSFRVAYLALPVIPALLLGVIAVLAALRNDPAAP